MMETKADVHAAQSCNFRTASISSGVSIGRGEVFIKEGEATAHKHSTVYDQHLAQLKLMAI